MPPRSGRKTLVTNDPDPTRGTGSEKQTEGVAPGYDGPGAESEPPGSATPDPARGGCLKLGWGCLPVLAGIALIPAGLFF